MKLDVIFIYFFVGRIFSLLLFVFILLYDYSKRFENIFLVSNNIVGTEVLKVKIIQKFKFAEFKICEISQFSKISRCKVSIHSRFKRNIDAVARFLL